MGLQDRINEARERAASIGRCWDGAVDARRCVLQDGHAGAHERPGGRVRWQREGRAKDLTGAER